MCFMSSHSGSLHRELSSCIEGGGTLLTQGGGEGSQYINYRERKGKWKENGEIKKRNQDVRKNRYQNFLITLLKFLKLKKKYFEFQFCFSYCELKKNYKSYEVT